MSCKCRNDIEKNLLDRFKDQNPEAKEHSAELKGYAFSMSGGINGRMVMKGVMPIELTADFPLKKGGFKRRTVKQSMMFNYCPFCGKKHESQQGEQP